ncbi:hypothetical protein BOX15_Mlig031400g2 [Macrostomum lignano]|uniref:SNF-related serine/threonine-protein kinase n=1 Tax=Macrostomum lignano TaxID=282301 RepID=A0A267DNA5_9PLAT|nr:hypothetical protein BOX15_Mlig031400g2 [Macrostomum lignano]
MSLDPAVQRRQQLQPNRHYSCDSAEMRIAGQYELHHTIGRGHFAVVKLARHVFTGEQVAIKVIDKAKLDSSNRESLYQEVMCMKLVQHPNVVRLYDVIDTPNKLYLILELGNGGDLYDFIVRQDDNSGLKESLAKSFFYQIVTAIAYCHRLHVCHRDLKLENCVVFERLGVVKLTDFGFSNVFTPGKYLETSCGSLAYSAPEILLGDSYDAPKVDVWSLGVILFMLVSGRLPFQEPNDSETLARIMDVRYKVPKHVTDQCRSLISRLLQRDPSKRPTLDGILTDDWFADVQHSVYDERPLISLGRISQADQQEVIGKMVDGGLATEQEILEALERDDYSYITSTFYLLAERLIKRNLASPAAGSSARHLLLQHQQHQSQRKTSDPSALSAASADIQQQQQQASSGGGSSRQSSSASLSVEEKLRRFSMILEEEDDDVACLEEAGAAGAAAAAAGSGTPPVRLQSPQFSGGGGVGGRLSSLSGLAALCDPIREEETGEGGVLQIPTPVLSSSALFPGAATLQSANIGGGGSSTSSQKRRSSAARESSFSLSSLASSLRSLSSQRVAVDLMRDLGGCPSPINNGSKQNSCVFYPASGNTTTSTTTSNNNNSNSTILAATTAPVASTDEVDLEADSDDDCDREIIDNNSGDDTVDSSRKNATRSSSSNKQPRKESDSNHNRRTGLSGHVNQCVSLSSEEIHRASDSGSSTRSQKQKQQQQQQQAHSSRQRRRSSRSSRQRNSRQIGRLPPHNSGGHQQRNHSHQAVDINSGNAKWQRQQQLASCSRQDSGLVIAVANSSAQATNTAQAASKASMEKFRIRCCTIS